MRKINVFHINARQCLEQGVEPRRTAVDILGLCTYASYTTVILQMEDGVLEEHKATNLQVMPEDYDWEEPKAAEVKFPVDVPTLKKVDTTQTTGVTDTPKTTGVDAVKKSASTKPAASTAKPKKSV